jgi:hypothetical protein
MTTKKEGSSPSASAVNFDPSKPRPPAASLANRFLFGIGSKRLKETILQKNFQVALKTGPQEKGKPK